jgi:hypothetical protein
MLNISSHKGNVNQNDIEISPHKSQDVVIKNINNKCYTLGKRRLFTQLL